VTEGAGGTASAQLKWRTDSALRDRSSSAVTILRALGNRACVLDQMRHEMLRTLRGVVAQHDHAAGGIHGDATAAHSMKDIQRFSKRQSGSLCAAHCRLEQVRNERRKVETPAHRLPSTACTTANLPCARLLHTRVGVSSH
jgi:hypothetical protein